MDSEVLHACDLEGVTPPELDIISPTLPALPVVVVPALALAACGGGGTSSGTATPSAAAPPPPPPPPPPPTSTQAGRFLAQATMGSTAADITAVTAQGYDGWLGAQFAKPRASTFWDWLQTRGHNSPDMIFRDDGFDPMIWSALISSEDQLRQRVSVALLSMLVVSIESTPAEYKPFAMAGYLDILWDNAFGNYRTLLDKISLNPIMAYYLTFLNNRKANAVGAQPDENYAREVMQLFTIGLYQLNLDGTVKQSGGKPIETYTLEDVSGLARVFTGWVMENPLNTTPDRYSKPLIQNASWHELGEKKFLGTTIPAGTDGVASLKIALDTLFAHPNVAPFVSKQLIQHLVTSNPSPAYVQRVATVFQDNGSGTRGDLRAVVRAILLDNEARDEVAAASSTKSGKLREPVLRFTGWARAFGATSPSDKWPIGSTASSTNRLGQSIGRSPSVFNFFRPGYVPPGSQIATQNLVAPEFQITNEISVISYINYIQVTMRDGWGDFKGNYTEYVAKAADSQALLDMINLRVAANQVSAATIAQIKTAVDSLASVTPTDLQNRVNVATVLIMASPEYLILK
jgi:uncharacterized protein (DUF1800 family)